jgi:hypothetical protein
MFGQLQHTTQMRNWCWYPIFIFILSRHQNELKDYRNNDDDQYSDDICSWHFDRFQSKLSKK